MCAHSCVRVRVLVCVWCGVGVWGRADGQGSFRLICYLIILAAIDRALDGKTVSWTAALKRSPLAELKSTVLGTAQKNTNEDMDAHGHAHACMHARMHT